MVRLSTHDINLEHIYPSPKFKPRFVGPFKVLKTPSSTTCTLDLPPHMKIHNVFHVSKLLPYTDPSTFHPSRRPHSHLPLSSSMVSPNMRWKPSSTNDTVVPEQST